jgi:hypothetical protein
MTLPLVEALRRIRDAHALSPVAFEQFARRLATVALAEWETLDIDELAREFHDTYERLAPGVGWKTQERSARPWNEVPEENRELMRQTIASVLGRTRSPGTGTR